MYNIYIKCILLLQGIKCIGVLIKCILFMFVILVLSEDAGIMRVLQVVHVGMLD